MKNHHIHNTVHKFFHWDPCCNYKFHIYILLYHYKSSHHSRDPCTCIWHWNIKNTDQSRFSPNFFQDSNENTMDHLQFGNFSHHIHISIQRILHGIGKFHKISPHYHYNWHYWIGCHFHKDNCIGSQYWLSISRSDQHSTI